jgi:tetratricopeptide (TPR) repeat protein
LIIDLHGVGNAINWLRLQCVTPAARAAGAVMVVFFALCALFVSDLPVAALAAPAPETPEPVRKDDAEALADYTVGVFLLESGSAQAAIGHLESAWEKSGHDAQIGEKLADACFQVGEFERCEAVLDELLSADADNFEGLLMKAKILYLRSQREEAAVCLERLEATADPSFEVQRILAKIYTELGRWVWSRVRLSCTISMDFSSRSSAAPSRPKRSLSPP